jgi:2,5-diketo-D-gluconate reductase A
MLVLHRGSIVFELSEEQMTSIATLDTGESQFFDHRDPSIVAHLGGVRVD